MAVLAIKPRQDVWRRLDCQNDFGGEMQAHNASVRLMEVRGEACKPMKAPACSDCDVTYLDDGGTMCGSECARAAEAGRDGGVIDGRVEERERERRG